MHLQEEKVRNCLLPCYVCCAGFQRSRNSICPRSRIPLAPALFRQFKQKSQKRKTSQGKHPCNFLLMSKFGKLDLEIKVFKFNYICFIKHVFILLITGESMLVVIMTTLDLVHFSWHKRRKVLLEYSCLGLTILHSQFLKFFLHLQKIRKYLRRRTKDSDF